MEASVTGVVAVPNSLLDVHIPSTFRWRYGRLRSAPARVPELAPLVGSGPHDREGSEPELACQTVQNLEGSAELRVVKRDECFTELSDLKTEISALRRERDELLTVAVLLSAEVSDLQSERHELMSLRTEIQELRRRKSLFEQSISALRRPVANLGRAGKWRFDDS